MRRGRGWCGAAESFAGLESRPVGADHEEGQAGTSSRHPAQVGDEVIEQARLFLVDQRHASVGIAGADDGVEGLHERPHAHVGAANGLQLRCRSQREPVGRRARGRELSLHAWHVCGVAIEVGQAW